jgi:non-specific serine/threonine protein kinase
MGKTRLAIEIAAAVRDEFAGGVLFVELAAVPSTPLAMDTIAHTMGLVEEPGTAAREQVIAALSDVNLLLVIDNFEHLLGAASELAELLAACPHLKLLVTSRALLRVAGEQAIPVPPLELPVGVGYEQLAHSAAIELFATRAHAVDPGFVLDERNVDLVAEICARMGAMPLGIELSAAQIAVLPLTRLLEQIKARLPLPISGPRDAPTRLRTLHDAVAWSYELLQPAQQMLFLHLSVFPGGFSLDAAQFLIGRLNAGLANPGEAIAQIAALVESSLVRRQPLEDEARFTMLEPIRDFAIDLLQRKSEFAAAKDALAAWCLQLAESSAMANFRPASQRELRVLERENASFRATMEWLNQEHDATRLLRLAAALGRFWQTFGFFREGFQWLELALADETADAPRARALALMQFSRYAYMLGDFPRANRMLPESMALFTALDDRAGMVSNLVGQGVIAAQFGNFDQGERLLNQALEIARTIADPGTAAAAESTIFANLGIAAQLRGDLAEARRHHEYALRLRLDGEDTLGAIGTLLDLGDVTRDLGDLVASIGYYQRCAKLILDQGDARVALDIFVGSALLAALWDEHVRAARFIGVVQTLGAVLGSPALSPINRGVDERAAVIARRALGQPRFEREVALGRDLSLAAALAEVLEMAPPVQDQPATDDLEINLSPREREVLTLLATGLTDRQIADALFISVRTAEGHVGRLIAKLGVQGRTAAVRAALDMGIGR